MRSAVYTIIYEHSKNAANTVFGPKEQFFNSLLNDFHPDKIADRESKQKDERDIMELLGRFSAQMLKDGLRGNKGHPKPEWGEGSSWRYFFIKECERRGRKLLENLGWPLDNDARYRNIHTGSVERLNGIAALPWKSDSDDPIAEEAWSIVEHWEPYLTTDSGD